MSHAQQQILEAVRDALLAADTDAGASVHLDRVDPLEDRELPALLIAEAPEGETVDPQTVSSLESRVLSVVVVSVVAGGPDFGARARELARQVEVALGTPGAAIPKAGRCRIAGSRLQLSGEGDKPRAAREQTWRVQYFTRRGAPDIAN